MQNSFTYSNTSGTHTGIPPEQVHTSPGRSRTEEQDINCVQGSLLQHVILGENGESSKTPTDGKTILFKE
jgi:hypothetical protein